MYTSFHSDELKPSGWLAEQLRIQAEGLSGNLDRVWPDVRDSAWFGGEREGWERAPYWLDGFIPLAYLLGREDLIERADGCVSGILGRQEEDGWICPCKKEERAGYDLWAYLLVCKMLSVYCSFNENPENEKGEKAEKSLYRALYCLYDLMKKGEVRLNGWGYDRWFEGLIPLTFLRERHGEGWMSELGELLREQGARYEDYEELWKRPKDDWTKPTHIVNLCMALKIEALCCAFFDEKPTGSSERMWKILDAYNGTAVGTFTGDECLSGIGNNRGTELCAVVELMHALEWNYKLTGDPVWAERLEKAAFNALPATLSDDMWSHQYVQQVNQIACRRFPNRSFFRTNSGESHLFGLEPNYGCCTANFSQGWPKLAMSTMLQAGNGIHIAHLLPAVLKTKIGEANVTVTVESGYPFRTSARIVVEWDRPTPFRLSVRIPSFVKALMINGLSRPVSQNEFFCCGSGEFEDIKRAEFEIEFYEEPHLTRRPHDLYAVEYGPLVFSLPLKADYRMLEYKRGCVERRFPYCDYELTSGDEWRYGFSDVEFVVKEKDGDGVPFSSLHPRVVLAAKMKRAAWQFADGFDSVANETPDSDAAIGEEEEKELYPYGCAKLRMTEMPLLK